MQRLIFSLILHHVDQFYNNKKLVKLLLPRPGGTFLIQVGTSLSKVSEGKSPLTQNVSPGLLYLQQKTRQNIVAYFS
mgnify:CR=1 FL=1